MKTKSSTTKVRSEVFFTEHPVFTAAEFDAFLKSRGTFTTGSENRKTLLQYHQQRGRIVPVRRGLYASIPPGKDPDHFPVDSFLIASRITEDAVLAYHTALALHGVAHSIREERVVLSEKAPARPFRFQGVIYRAVSPSTALPPRERLQEGVETQDRSGLLLRVTTLERAIVDVLDRPALAGGWEETWRSLEGIDMYLNTEVLLRYALHLGNATTAAKVGYFLETNRERLHVNEASLELLRAKIPERPHYVERNARFGARLVKGWNLMVPAALFSPGEMGGTGGEDDEIPI